MLARILWGLVLALLAFWLIGRLFRLLGNLIHIALIVALIIVIYNVAFARRRTY